MEYTIKYSNRKTLSIEVTSNLEILVRSPRWVSKTQIDKFVTERSEWIEAAMSRQQHLKEQEDQIPRLTRLELNYLADQAMSRIPERVRFYAPIVGVNYGRITIRNQTTRWGSCSSAGNLNFNCLLMLVPDDVLDYVVVHELCHRIEMNHSKRFWQLVESILPDYKERRKWLNENGSRIMSMQKPLDLR